METERGLMCAAAASSMDKRWSVAGSEGELPEFQNCDYDQLDDVKRVL